MKARTSFYYKLNNREREELKSYVRQLVRETYKKDGDGLFRRFFKLTAIALHRDYGFGTKRIDKLFSTISELSQTENQKELWKEIDKVLGEQLKLGFPIENYDDLDK